MKGLRSLCSLSALTGGMAAVALTVCLVSGSAVAQSAIPWPVGSTTVVYGHRLPTAKADRCTRKACFNVFQPYHNTTYAQLGRLTGYYAARRFVPAGGQPVVLYRLTSVYRSSSAANEAWNDEDRAMTDLSVDCFTKACTAVADRRHKVKRLMDWVVKNKTVIEVMAETTKANLANVPVATGLISTLKSLEPAGSGQPPL